MASALPPSGWEAMFAPYDAQTYRTVLDQLGPEEIVLDIGAGDLRLARQMARLVRKVYAVEINPQVLDQASVSPEPLPPNLIPVCADARTLEFPSGITTGVLLMRHCTCFRHYAEKLQEVGAARLITNARWRMDVEVINLPVEGKLYREIPMGWFTCICGGTGFKEGPAEQWTTEMNQITNEVSNCPQCMQVF